MSIVNTLALESNRQIKINFDGGDLSSDAGLLLKKNVRKVSKAAIYDWLNKSEIYDVDIDNAFDLLSSLAGGTVEKDTLEFGIEAFRKYSANAASVLPELKECVVRHTK